MLYTSIRRDLIPQPWHGEHESLKRMLAGFGILLPGRKVVGLKISCVHTPRSSSVSLFLSGNCRWSHFYARSIRLNGRRAHSGRVERIHLGDKRGDWCRNGALFLASNVSQACQNSELGMSDLLSSTTCRSASKKVLCQKGLIVAQMTRISPIVVRLVDNTLRRVCSSRRHRILV